MKKYSSTSNSRSRSRSNNRYFNQKRRSDGSVSPDNSKHSKHYTSSCSSGYMKSKLRSSSPSEHLSSRYKHSNRSSNSNSSYNQLSTSGTSNYDRKNDLQNSKFTAQNEISVKPEVKYEVKTEVKTEPDEDSVANCVKKNILDILKRDSSIEQINRDGFLFQLFKPLTEKKFHNVKLTDYMEQLNEEIVHALSFENPKFLMLKPEDLLCERFMLHTKQERCKIWAKTLFGILDQSE